MQTTLRFRILKEEGMHFALDMMTLINPALPFSTCKEEQE